MRSSSKGSKGIMKNCERDFKIKYYKNVLYHTYPFKTIQKNHIII